MGNEHDKSEDRAAGMKPPNPAPDGRVFLFLQGPHGPFFHALGRMLQASGAKVWRVGFNAGDRAFWFDKASYIPYRGTLQGWPTTLQKLIDLHGATDLVLYGDVRPIHAHAIKIAKAQGLRIHVFEEGYLRPWWVTYERDGSNGNSRLMELEIAQMQAALQRSATPAPPPPAHWGDMYQHVFYGAVYHWFVLFMNGRYRSFRPHRDIPVSQEFRLYFRRLMLMPFHRALRSWATTRVRRGGFPYHLVLLQLGHDSSVQAHSEFSSTTEFLIPVMEGFARGAPAHHHLVIKEHPLENHREPLHKRVREIARRLGIADRVHHVPGGKLARLMDHADSAVTINSTAGQQALWRGIPLRVFGRSVYDKPELVSHQPVEDFFAHPKPPDAKAYQAFRQFLLDTSQIPGGFYSRRGRRQILRRVVDRMLSPCDPYQSMLAESAANAPQLQIVE
ncbi:capsule polysaccharide modification protein [Ruegeria lacuscaerulensis ITI-1157]|nr:capsule polysaccharide modification protein [Ruegeria lacuscaerulensis ITI-1157]